MNLQNIVISVDDAQALSAMLSGTTLHQAAGSLGEAFDGAEVVTADRVPSTVVSLNALVDYIELGSGAKRSITLVAPADADPTLRRISVLSPVGRALLGRAVGAVTEVELPSGQTLELEITEVKQAALDGASLSESA